MKQFLVFLFCLVSLSSFSQTDYYNARRTELYEKSGSSWIKYSTNADANISVSLSRNVVQVMAKNATSFKLDYSSLNEQRFDGFKVTTFTGYEIVNGRDCVIDFVKYDNTNYLVFSVVYMDVSPNINIRYYLLKD